MSKFVKRFKSKILLSLIFSLINSYVYAHGGRLNSDGCHNNTKTGDYHCHSDDGSAPLKNQNEITPINEDYYNNIFAKTLGGKREVRIKYFVKESGLSGYVIIDIETSEMVIEGGLDKRSSLDSIQQAVFASTLTGKQPAVAIYDTDGQWGRIEHRILTAAKAIGVKFYWISNGIYEEK